MPSVIQAAYEALGYPSLTRKELEDLLIDPRYIVVNPNAFISWDTPMLPGMELDYNAISDISQGINSKE